MDLPSLVYRRYRCDMIEIYKFIHGIYKSGHNLLPLAPSSALRGHIYKLKKRHCYSQMRSNFFSFRVVNLWNNLPSDVVSAPSVNVFKERLDKHWKEYLLYTRPCGFYSTITSDQLTRLSGLMSRAEDKGKGNMFIAPS